MRGTFSTTATPVGTDVPFVSNAPSPTAGQPFPGFIVVQTHAAAFNPVDNYIAAEFLAARGPVFKMPRSVGADFAGVITAVGDGAMLTAMDGTRRAAVIGDEVFGDGIVGTGSFAEFVSVMSDQAVLKPATFSFAEAAALPLAGLTAFQAFTKHATKPVGPGSKVLVLGGTGGVGSIAVQIAKALGATVAATGSNTELLGTLGVDTIINYREQDWGEKLAGQNYDLIFATVNDDKPSPAAERALKVLGPAGCFLCLLDSTLPAPDLNLGGRKFSTYFADSTDYTGLVTIATMAVEGKIKPVFSQGKTFPFTAEGWTELMSEAKSGRAKGKLVMSIIG